MEKMKQQLKLLFTDSGLGGLSIMAEAADFLIKEKPFESVDLIYFNSTPDKKIGYNKMPNDDERIAVFNSALYSMKEKYNPDFIFIACNTLSVIYEQTKFAKEEKVPVETIVKYGVNSMKEKLQSDPKSQVIILGTPTTINKNTYKLKLIESGIDETRIINQACPDLESEIQINPESDKTRNLIQKYLAEALEKLPDKSAKTFLSLCCTHYGFAEKVFESMMNELRYSNYEVINPNKKMVESIKEKFKNTNCDQIQLSSKVVSKVIFFEDEISSISKLIEKISPLVADSLRDYELKEDLF
ncbi:MAG: aspartate/glutamate racemase family protein [Ignavibacteria bacterium]|jgi:glutamate racemase|nr:aspartate/glutamate racemase family protein [Ignavibacteria bacterium]MDH7528346.1 aspartate/glutamate racemase family protein [Ignavibacteria bacterium]